MSIEIELKIIRLREEDQDATNLQKRVEALGGRLDIPRRLLEDILFRFPLDHQPARTVRTIALRDFDNNDQLKSVVTYLGLEWKEEKDGHIVTEKPAELPKRTVRIRRDGTKVILNVKEPRIKGVAIDERIEEEVGVAREEAARELLFACGYTLEGKRQKYRTSFMLGDALVEVNEGPRVPPWIEVEAPSQESVFAAIQRLGYSTEDCAAMGDTQYYVNHGMPEDKLYAITFGSSDAE